MRPSLPYSSLTAEGTPHHLLWSCRSCAACTRAENKSDFLMWLFNQFSVKKTTSGVILSSTFDSLFSLLGCCISNGYLFRLFTTCHSVHVTICRFRFACVFDFRMMINCSDQSGLQTQTLTLTFRWRRHLEMLHDGRLCRSIINKEFWIHCRWCCAVWRP